MFTDALKIAHHIQDDLSKKNCMLKLVKEIINDLVLSLGESLYCHKLVYLLGRTHSFLICVAW